MKKIEYAELNALGASAAALNYYSGTDMIRAIWQDGTHYIVDSIDGKIEYSSAAELIADLEAMAAEEARLLAEFED